MATVKINTKPKGRTSKDWDRVNDFLEPYLRLLVPPDGIDLYKLYVAIRQKAGVPVTGWMVTNDVVEAAKWFRYRVSDGVVPTISPPED